MADLYAALGQYQFYASLLAPDNLYVPIYLVMPHEVHSRLTTNPDVANFVTTLQIKFVLVDLDKEEIIQWIP